jgi:hypothetical protein
MVFFSWKTKNASLAWWNNRSCDFTPVSTNRIRVEQAQICDDVLFVVNGQYGIGGRGIGDIEIKRRLLHWPFSQQVVDRPTLLWTSGIFMTAKPSPRSHQ